MEERLSATASSALTGDPELITEVRNGVATATLNRPGALNAITPGMLKALAATIVAWERDDAVKIVVLRGAGEKAFCAGGDVRGLYEGYRSGRKDLLDFFIIEYALDYHIHTFPKPVVAVMDGIVMGGGMGLAQGATLRIATDRTKMAMPETTIGLFPDVGGSWFLPRTPGHLGTYLGLVGPTIKAADAIYANLADVYLSADALSKLDAELTAAAASADPRGAVKAIAPRLGSTPPGPSELPPLREAIEQHFGQPDVLSILRSLENTPGPWAAKILSDLVRRSPTALAVTLKQLQKGKTLTLAEVFRMELGMVQAVLEHGDFMEGVRALLIDKDNNPRWNPPHNYEVEPRTVEKFFEPRWTGKDHPLKDLAS